MKSNTTASTSSRGPKLHPADWVLQSGALADVLDEMQIRLRQRRRKRKLAAGGASAAAGLLILVFWLFPLVTRTSSVATLPAQRRTIALADGSQAELNAHTSLHTDFRYGRRTVRLDRGEAFFSVARDPAHPFLVETSAGTVRVTGTKFNVRLGSDHQVEVTLLEGAVAMEPPALGPRLPATPLVPGQQGEFNAGRAELRTLSPVRLARVIAWREGRVVFDGDALADAAARFADYHGVAITVAPEVARLHLGGSYPLAELPGFLGALETTLPVRVERQGEAYRIVAR